MSFDQIAEMTRESKGLLFLKVQKDHQRRRQEVQQGQFCPEMNSYFF